MATLIGTTVQLDVNQEIESTYDWVVDADAPIRFIHKWGPVPGFKTYQLLSGDWKHESASRRVTLEDGGIMIETIKTIGRPTYFDYELTEFKNMSPMITMLLKRGYGQWWFTTTPSGTHVKWKYAFEPQSRWVTPFVWLFMKLIYRNYMKAAMREMKRFSVGEGFTL